MKKIIFFSYDGLNDPLGQSQIEPYIKYLSNQNYLITLISFEKKKIFNKYIQYLDKHIYIKFNHGKVGKLINVISGILAIRSAIKKQRPDLIHIRGFIPGLIFYLSRKKIKYLYDFRSFAVGEHVDTGNLKKNSFLHKLFVKIDNNLVKNSAGIVVLEECAKKLLFKTYKVPNVPIEIIRTCADQSAYKKKNNYSFSINKTINFVSLGGARNPYRSDIILYIIKCLLENGINCKLDFINKNDKIIILKNAKKINFPIDKLNIYSMNHNNISEHLIKFDFGLIFYHSTKWRRVCSPTKLGEFLSAGLPVISLEGIDIIDDLNKKFKFIHCIKSKDLNSKNFLEDFKKFIQSSFENNLCQKLALSEFNINNANLKYKNIYQKILYE